VMIVPVVVPSMAVLLRVVLAPSLPYNGRLPLGADVQR
jgi:hypothetical protein